jgi:4-amino-4-deoxy-L-arabinose transferase-like glycosyltransferase
VERVDEIKGPEPSLAPDEPAGISPLVLWSGLVLLVIIGLAFRLHDLGRLGLLVDEGNQAIAIAGILEHGIPISDSGWPYARNLLFQYIQAASALGFGLDEFSLRLPSALFGAASIFSSFALARALFGDRVALFTAALVCLSLWEISFSRYARPYTALQFLYCLGLFCFYRGFMRGERPFQLGFVATLLMLFPIHEFGVVLATCFAIPFLMSEAWSLRRKLAGVASAAIIGFTWLAYQRTAEALVGQLTPPHGLTHLPSALAGARAFSWWPGPRIWAPDLSSIETLAVSAPLLLSVPLGIAIIACGLLFMRLRGRDRFRLPLLCAMVGAAGLHQIGLALLFGVADIVLFGRRESAIGQTARPAWLATFASLVFWMILFVPRMTGWREPMLLLFGYPNVLQHCIYFLATGWPVIAVGGFAGCVLLGRELIQDRRSTKAAFALGALLIPIVATSFFRSFFEARYIFHLFPLLLSIYAFVAVGLADAMAWRVPAPMRRPAFAGILVVALLAMGEANPVAAWGVGDRDYASQLNPSKGVISWQAYADFHQDHKTPSLYVSRRRTAGDRVIVFGAPHMIGVYAHYLGRIDLAVGRPQDRGYLRRRGEENVGWVTGIPTITLADELVEALRAPADGTTWLLGDHVLLRADNSYFDEDVKTAIRRLAEKPDYLGLDGQTFAVRVP